MAPDRLRQADTGPLSTLAYARTTLSAYRLMRGWARPKARELTKGESKGQPTIIYIFIGWLSSSPVHYVSGHLRCDQGSVLWNPRNLRLGSQRPWSSLRDMASTWHPHFQGLLGARCLGSYSGNLFFLHLMMPVFPFIFRASSMVRKEEIQSKRRGGCKYKISVASA